MPIHMQINIIKIALDMKFNKKIQQEKLINNIPTQLLPDFSQQLISQKTRN